MRATLGVSYHGDAVAHVEGFFRGDAMSDEASGGIERTAYVSETLRAGVVIEAADVRHLAAGFGVDGGAIEHDFAVFAGFEFVDGAAFGDDRFDAAIFGSSGEIKARLGLEGVRNFCIDGIDAFLGCALPGGARASAL